MTTATTNPTRSARTGNTTPPSGPSGPRVVAVAGGRGGTGRSLLVANLSLLLATLGKRVVAVDAAPGAGCLHIMLGLSDSRRSLAEALRLGGPPLLELVAKTTIPGLGLVPAEGWAGTTELDHAAAARLSSQFSRLEADFVLVDLPAGSSRYVLDLFLGADARLLVVLPEPPAVELGYAFLRAALARRLERTGLGELVAGGDLPMPLDLVDQIVGSDTPDAGDRAAQVRAAIASLHTQLVVNQVRSKADTELGQAISTAAHRRLGLPLRYLGHIDYDDAVWVSLRRRRALLVEHPEARASKCIEKVTRRLLAREAEPPAWTGRAPASPPPATPAPLAPGAATADDADATDDRVLAGEPRPVESHYQLLEIEPTASEEDIRRAHRRVRQVYGRDAIAVSGLYTREGVDALQRRFDDAYATLMDPARRKAYDLDLFPDGVPAAARPVPRRGPGSEAVPVGARGPAPTLPPDVDITGALLREVREKMGVELREISERTKVGMGYLTAIEDERFERLPAPVYVRGFLVEYCKMLGIDVARALETYYARFQQSRAPREGGDAR